MASYDREFWESLWAKTLREHPDKVSRRAPSRRLTSEVEELPAGRALDAGCGHGAESLWLALRGWRVTAVDFSRSALDHARSVAEAAPEGVAERIDWVYADLSQWAPETGHYDLVVSLYVHIPGPVEAMVRRLAGGVAPGGTLLLVGHRPVDPATGAATAAAGQVQVSVDEAVSVLDSPDWSIAVAENRQRCDGSGVDAVIRAVRAD